MMTVKGLIFPFTVLLAFATLCQLSCAEMPTTNGTACSMVFNIQKTPEGATNLLSISMPTLQTMLDKDTNEAGSVRQNPCTIVFAMHPTIQDVPLPVSTQKPVRPTSTARPTSTVRPTSTARPISSSTTKPSTSIPWSQRPWVQQSWTQKPWSQQPWSQQPWTQGPTTLKPTTPKPTTSVKPTIIWSTTVRPTTVSATVRPTTVQSVTVPSIVQPLHEEQLAVWPDEQDVADMAEQADQEDGDDTGALPPVPLYEEQLAVFPDWAVDTDHTVTTGSTTTVTPVTQEHIEVLENYKITHPNGTIEYKLALSNGLVNYKKMYMKLFNGKLVPVQEGYDSVPLAGRDQEYQTQYYIADEAGYRVYKIEHSFRRPELPKYLNYAEVRAGKGAGRGP